MEREKKLAKLIRVLGRTSRMARRSGWTGGRQEAAAFCTYRYNLVLARLEKIDPKVSSVFEPLPDQCSLTVVAMACNWLAAYYEEELGPRTGFKKLWKNLVREFEGVIMFIRQSIEKWSR